MSRERIGLGCQIAAIVAGVVVLAPVLASLLSLATSPDAGWTARAVLAGFGILAIVRPDAALLVTVSLIGFGGILSQLVGIPSTRVAEILVVMSLAGLLLRAFPRASGFRRTLIAQISAPIVLFAIAAVSSTIVWLRVQQVETDYVSSFLRSLFLFVTRGYFADPGDFWLVVSAAVMLEGLALYIVVGALCRLRPTFFEQCLRMFALGGAALAVMSVVRLAEILLRDSSAIAVMRGTPNGLRISPQIPDYIAAGSYFSLCWIILLALAVASPGRRLLWLTAGAPLVAALYLTGSRSVIAAALAGVLVLGITVVRLRATAVRVVLAAAVAGLGLMAVSYPRLIGRDFGGETARRSLQVRVELARTSFRIIASRPLFGVGIDRYHIWSGRLASPELNALFPARKNAHNDFLRVGAELGLVGLALFLWILAAAVGRVWQALRSTQDARLAGLAGGLVAFLVTSMVSNPLLVRDVSYGFWIALGLAVARSVQQTQNVRDGPVPSVVREQEVIAPSPWRWRVAALAAALLVLSIPFRARQEVAAVDLTHLSYGLFGWETDRTGARFRWSGAESTFFVDGTAQRVEIELGGVALPSGSERHVEIRVDGQLANRVVVTPRWQRVRTTLPSVPSRRPRRIDLHVSQAWVPADTFPESGDRRVLGVKVGEIAVVADPALEHAGIGLSDWERHPDGTEYRAAGADSTVFVPHGAAGISIPLRAMSPECCRAVELRLDGRLANVVSVGADSWHRVHLLVPPPSRAAGFRRIDVHVVDSRPSTGNVLMIGKVESR